MAKYFRICAAALAWFAILLQYYLTITKPGAPFLEATVRLAPDYAAALRDLGTVYLQAGAEAKARVVLEKSAALNPDDADTHFQMSRLYNIVGERELAKKHLEIFQKLKNPRKDGMP